MRPTRKLENILQDLIPLEQRGRVTRFLNSIKDVDKLDGLAGDIHDTMVDYQVCPKDARPTLPNISVRHHYSRISMKRVVASL